MVRLHAAWSIDLKGKKVRLSEDAEYMQPAAWRYSPVGEKSIMCIDAPAISGAKLKAVSTSVLQTVSKSVGSNISFYVDGENTVKVEVFTTLANAIKDPVSMFVPLARTGISGNVSLLYK